jgi:hypothetical protein
MERITRLDSSGLETIPSGQTVYTLKIIKDGEGMTACLEMFQEDLVRCDLREGERLLRDLKPYIEKIARRVDQQYNDSLHPDIEKMA